MGEEPPQVSVFFERLVELHLVLRGHPCGYLLAHVHEAGAGALPDLIKYLRLLLLIGMCQVLNSFFEAHIIEEELRLENF